MMEKHLQISEKRNYLVEVDEDGNQVPFFWLGDTAWLLFEKLSCEEADHYFQVRKQQKFNVIQAVLYKGTECWEKIDVMLKMAEEYGFYMALLPVWGDSVKKNILNMDNVKEYAEFLVKRYGHFKNIIWTLGGDIRGDVGTDIWNTFGEAFKKWSPEHLITFHPFGRTSSAMWFQDCDWLDFNMFQSGHRRYDQRDLGSWDDNGVKEEWFGEDNWRYVKRELNRTPLKPVLDGEPSYEGLPQGLHDTTQPYWEAKDVRRYAYWSVFEGACGHTYGHNAVMQFYGDAQEKPNYGPKLFWNQAMLEPGAGQMTILTDLMNSVDFTTGKAGEDMLVGEQGKQYERISIFKGADFVFVYNYSGRPFVLDMSQLEMKVQAAQWMNPENGKRMDVERFAENVALKTGDSSATYEFIPPKRETEKEGTDWILVLRGE